MDIEELSKSQLILLTILVNFVTSIATGILTVSLLDHTPAFVTQTVNRVVEHMVETVASPAVIVQQPSPAPSNQDLVTAAIGASASRTVAIYAAETGTSTKAISVGTYLPKNRAVITAAQDSLPKDVLIEFTNGAHIAGSIDREGKGITVYGFANNITLPKMSSPALVPASSLKLGQTVLAVGSDGFASTGIVSRVNSKGIYTTLPNIGTGSAVVDLSGNLIGIDAGSVSGFLLESDAIASLLAATSTTATSAAATK